MNKIKLWFRAVFGFSQTEINGFIILSILMVLLLIAPFLYSSIYTSDKIDHTKDQEILSELLTKASNFKKNKFEEIKKVESLKKLTKSKKEEKPKNHILKSEDEQLNESNSKWIPNKYKKEITPIEVNSADTNAFKQIRGIGSKLSQRIIKYRDKLGGFHSLNQLYEVYGIDSTLINNNFKHFIEPNLSLIKPINLDTSSVKTLIKHPYIDYKKAIAISNYRKQHGNYKSVEDLRKLHLLKEKDIEKISPYLLFK